MKKIIEKIVVLLLNFLKKLLLPSENVVPPTSDNEEISKPDVEIIPPINNQPEVETPEVETPEVELPEVETPEVETPEVEESKEENKEMTNLDYVEHFHDHLTVIDSGIEMVDIPPVPVIRTEVSFKYDGPYKIKFINVELSYYKFEETEFGVQPILLQDLSTYKVSFKDTAKGVDDVLVFAGFDNLEAQLPIVDILSIELEDGTIVNF